jgi:hypothetical protein
MECNSSETGDRLSDDGEAFKNPLPPGYHYWMEKLENQATSYRTVRMSLSLNPTSEASFAPAMGLGLLKH